MLTAPRLEAAFYSMSVTGTASADPWTMSPVPAGELIASKYIAERILGVGGMGIVLAGRDRLLDRPVAVKFLLPSVARSTIAVQRFLREARSAARISSEHVVRVLEIGELPDRGPYLVMEYLEGWDLREVLKERGYLPRGEAVDYVLQALQAIAEGHKHHVVHRDLKPSNLFLTRRADGSALVKVLDFGIAKSWESMPPGSEILTESNVSHLGSPAYMSPEQLRDPRLADARSDFWSLGVTLYEMLTGSLPYRASTYAELSVQILTEPMEDLRARRPDLDLPAELCAVLARCLRKAPAERFENAAELAQLLVPFGSEDSRLSGLRIQGLESGARYPSQVSGRRSSVPLPTACTTTIPAPMKTREPLRFHRRATLLLGASALAIATLWVIARRSQGPSPVSAIPSAPPPVAATINAAVTASPPPVHSDSKPLAAASIVVPARAPSASRAARPAPVSSAAQAAPAPAPDTTAPVTTTDIESLIVNRH